MHLQGQSSVPEGRGQTQTLLKAWVALEALALTIHLLTKQVVKTVALMH